MSPRPLLGALAVLLLLLSTACGGPTTSANSPEPDPAGDEVSGTVVVEDVRGEVELPAPAERVVALEWTYVEDRLAVGVQPVGVADIAGYDAYVTAGPRLAEDVVDVGTRQEPSLEAIAAPEPDLIVTDRNRAEANLAALERIAPVLPFDPYDGDQLVTMREDFTAVATAVGEAELAEAVLDGLDAAFEQASTELAAAGLEGAPVILAQGFSTEGSPTMRVFTDQALVARIVETAGLDNAHDGTDTTYGFDTLAIEALTAYDDAAFLYTAPPEDNVFEGAFAENPLWQDLGFVERGEVHALDPGTWFFGGPLSSEQVLDDVVRVLTS